MTITILQTPVDPSAVITVLGMGVKEVSIIGILLIALAIAGYVIKYIHKHNKVLNTTIVDLQEKRITEAKDSMKQTSELGIKFIEQTNKLLLALEMLKR